MSFDQVNENLPLQPKETPLELKPENIDFIHEFIEHSPEEILSKFQNELGWYSKECQTGISLTENNSFYNNVRELFELKDLYIGPGSDMAKIIFDLPASAKNMEINAILPPAMTKKMLFSDEKKTNGISVSVNEEGGLTLARMFSRHTREGRPAEPFNIFTIRWNVARFTDSGLEIFFKTPDFKEDWQNKVLRLPVTENNNLYTQLGGYSLQYNLIMAQEGEKNGWTMEAKSFDVIKQSLLNLKREELDEFLEFTKHGPYSPKETHQFIKEKFGKKIADRLGLTKKTPN